MNRLISVFVALIAMPALAEKPVGIYQCALVELKIKNQKIMGYMESKINIPAPILESGDGLESNDIILFDDGKHQVIIKIQNSFGIQTLYAFLKINGKNAFSTRSYSKDLNSPQLLETLGVGYNGTNDTLAVECFRESTTLGPVG